MMNNTKIVAWTVLAIFMLLLMCINIMTGNVTGLVFSVIAALWDLCMVIDTIHNR